MKVVLTIAGSDSSGGAGIQADLKAITACGGYGASAITALTAQNTCGVQAAQLVDPAFVRAQIGSVFDDLPVTAVKTGMLGSEAVVLAVAETLRERRPECFVLDPVVRATSGDPLIDEAGLAALERTLIPAATLVTPNVHEAAALTGLTVETPEQARRAGEALVARGARAVLVKGGELRQGGATDVLVTAAGVRVFHGEWIESRNTHGTGCTYAAAIATFLARGYALERAIGAAKHYVTEAIRAGLPLGAGHGPTDHFFFLRGPHAGWSPALDADRVPRLHVITDEQLQQRFSHQELAVLAAKGGADAVQYREKRPRSARDLVATAREIRQRLAGRGTQLIVDDRVDVALAVGAEGVHLGAEDLPVEVARRCLGGPTLVGATANSLDQALEAARGPVDYLGVGPVFGTTTKANPAPTLGLDGLRRIAVAVDKPVIAIGNISAERVPEVISAGAWGVAVTSAVVCAADPCAATRMLRQSVDAAVASVEKRTGCER